LEYLYTVFRANLFSVSVVQDASQKFILHNRNRLEPMPIGPASIMGDAHRRGVVIIFIKGSFQSKGGGWESSSISHRVMA
jgi:hypothetical protein